VSAVATYARRRPDLRIGVAVHTLEQQERLVAGLLRHRIAVQTYASGSGRHVGSVGLHRSTPGWTRAAGVFYVITFVAIPALLLIGPVLADPNYIVNDGVDTRILLGCVLDIVVALTGIGTAVALFPVLRHRNEGSALGFVTTRVFEAGVILIGVVSLMALVTLRQSIGGPAAADPAALVTPGQSLVAVRDVTFLLSPGVVPALNALLLAPILYRARLVPRILPIVGLIGVPLLLASSAATLFSTNGQVSGLSFLLGLFIAAWELLLGIWMTVKGFSSATPVGVQRSAGTSTDAGHPSVLPA
jgi:hypothetical protein